MARSFAHALDALKARLGLVPTDYTPQLDHIYGAQWSHLTPSEQNLFNRLSGFVQSMLSAASSRVSPRLFISPQDLLFTWLTLDEVSHTLNFKWRTIENLQWTDLSPAEQTALDEPNTCVYRDGQRVSGSHIARLLVLLLSHNIWITKRPGMRFQTAFEMTARPFPENFRSLSNAVG